MLYIDGTLLFLPALSGPIIWGPLSETIGRRPIFIFTFFLYTCFQLGCALSPNTASILGMSNLHIHPGASSHSCSSFSVSFSLSVSGGMPRRGSGFKLRCRYCGYLGHSHSREGDSVVHFCSVWWASTRYVFRHCDAGCIFIESIRSEAPLVAGFIDVSGVGWR